MTLETNTKVERLNVVQDSEGNDAAPATEQEQQAISSALSNNDSLTAFNHATSGTDAEPLPENAVPDGVEVLMYAKDANGGFVWVGDSATQAVPIKPGGSLTLAVSDTSAIYVRTPTSGDEVGVLYEDG